MVYFIFFTLLVISFLFLTIYYLGKLCQQNFVNGNNMVFGKKSTILYDERQEFKKHDIHNLQQ